jgi:hypothetical protein
MEERDCIEECNLTHRSDGKCDGHCPSEIKRTFDDEGGE